MKATIPVLIISTGRTGTVFFAELFRDVYPEVAAYHERGVSRPIQILTNAHFAHLFPLKGLEYAWRFLKGREISTCPRLFHVDANCFLYGLAGLAPRLYPGLRVVHIVRDPRTYVTSHLSFMRQRRRSFIANYLVPFWQPNPFLVGELDWKMLFTLSRFERFCWIWDFKNRVMGSLEGTQIPYLLVRFEDVFQSENPEKEFDKITDFIGLPRASSIQKRFSQPTNQTIRQTIPVWMEWLPARCIQLHAHCGERMKIYGYGNEPEWLAKLTISEAGKVP